MTAINPNRPSVAVQKPQIKKPPAVHPPQPKPETPPQASLEKVFTEFDKMWVQAHQETNKKLKLLAPESRGLMELQMKVSHLGFGTQLFAQGIESVRGTLQKVQQIGGS